MQIAEYDINSAEGAYLFADYKLDNKTYKQGHVLSPEDIIIFKMYGIKRVYGAFASEDDMDKQTALGIIAAKICGTNTAYAIAEDDEVKIVANADGAFVSSQERIRKFNNLHLDLILNTIPPFSKVSKGDVVAKLELSAPLITQDAVNDIVFSLSGNTSLLKIEKIRTQKTALLYTKILDDVAENQHFTTQATKLVSVFSEYGLEFSKEYSALYYQKEIVDRILDAVDDNLDILFVLSGSKSGCSNDVLPSSLRQIVDVFALEHFPQVGLSDLFIAQKRQTKIIILPYNYGYMASECIDDIIKQSVLSEKLISSDFKNISSCSLTEKNKLSKQYISQLIAAPSGVTSNKKADIAAVILAAGIGSRSGRNKLMVETKDGDPLFLKSVKTAISSNACPVFIITGYHHEEMMKYLDKLDVNVIHNPAYRSGIKTSIDLGLKSVPDFCDGAMLIPADMPNLEASDLNKLISSFKKTEENQLCMFNCKGVKHNPVIWSKSLYSKADIVPENSHLRAVFVEHSDYTNFVNIKDTNKVLDVNYPSDIEKV